MATTVNKYLDNADFLLATAVFDDAALTTPAADGFYQQNGIYREQSGGALIPGSTTCPSCSGNSQDLRLNGISAQDLCCVTSSLYTAYFAGGDSFTNPSTTLMYADAGLLTLAPDGFYKIQNSTQYREQSSGVLGALTSCPTCPSGGFFMSQGRSVCTDFCATSPTYTCTSQQFAVSGNDYFTLVVGDVIAGGFTFVDGFYAYAATSGVQTPNGVFKIMELVNNEVVSVLECANVPGGPCQNA